MSALVLFSPSLDDAGHGEPLRNQAGDDPLGRRRPQLRRLSTVGSVIGTLLLGFWILPLVGSREVLLGLGTGLL